MRKLIALVFGVFFGAVCWGMENDLDDLDMHNSAEYIELFSEPNSLSREMVELEGCQNCCAHYSGCLQAFFGCCLPSPCCWFSSLTMGFSGVALTEIGALELQGGKWGLDLMTSTWLLGSGVTSLAMTVIPWTLCASGFCVQSCAKSLEKDDFVTNVDILREQYDDCLWGKLRTCCTETHACCCNPIEASKQRMGEAIAQKKQKTQEFFDSGINRSLDYCFGPTKVNAGEKQPLLPSGSMG